MPDSMYNAAEYPQGVPNLYVPAVHPFPTTKHGPDYTRPVFGMPFVRRPMTVLAGLGEQPQWWPQVNHAGCPIVEPQPNPYATFWPEHLGQYDTDGNVKAYMTGLLTAAAIGAALGTVYRPRFPNAVLGGFGAALLAAMPIGVALMVQGAQAEGT